MRASTNATAKSLLANRSRRGYGSGPARKVGQALKNYGWERWQNQSSPSIGTDFRVARNSPPARSGAWSRRASACLLRLASLATTSRIFLAKRAHRKPAAACSGCSETTRWANWGSSGSKSGDSSHFHPGAAGDRVRGNAIAATHRWLVCGGAGTGGAFVTA